MKDVQAHHAALPTAAPVADKPSGAVVMKALAPTDKILRRAADYIKANAFDQHGLMRSRPVSAADPLGNGVARLLADLDKRDTDILDLAVVGRNLEHDLGQAMAAGVVVKAWNDLTNHAPGALAGDVMWLQDQKPRVRDVAWLYHFPEQWMEGFVK